MKLTKLIKKLKQIIDKNGEMDVYWSKLSNLLLCIQYNKQKGIKGIYMDLKEE